MFAMIPPSLIRDARLNRADLRVFVALASFADRDSRTCWPSRKALSLACGISSLALISGALQRLQRFGWVEIQHRYGSSVYRLLDGLERQLDPVHPVMVDPVHPVMVDMNRPAEHINFPPSPAPAAAAIEEREIEIIEAAPELPSASVEPAPAPETSETSPEQAVALIVALIAASGAQYSTKPGSGAVRAAEKALSLASFDDLRLVVAWCAASWSSPAFLTPSAVFRPDRIEERVAAAKAQAPAGTRQAAHRLFEREPEPERASPECVASHLSKLKQALRAA